MGKNARRKLRRYGKGKPEVTNAKKKQASMSKSKSQLKRAAKRKQAAIMQERAERIAANYDREQKVRKTGRRFLSGLKAHVREKITGKTGGRAKLNPSRELMMARTTEPPPPPPNRKKRKRKKFN